MLRQGSLSSALMWCTISCQGAETGRGGLLPVFGRVLGLYVGELLQGDINHVPSFQFMADN